MSRKGIRLKKHSQKAGLPPGTVVHTGERREGHAKVTLMRYSPGEFAEADLDGLDACPTISDCPGVCWINVDGVHDVSALERLGGCFGLHPLVLEDIANTDQRPKMEDHGDYIYAVFRMLTPGEGGAVISEQVSLVLGRNFVLSFQEEGKEGDVFDNVRGRIRADKGMVRKLGPGYLAYSLLDAVVDGYFVVLDALGERVEQLEDEVVADPRRETVNRIHVLKRETLFLRRSVWPLRELVGGLEKGGSALVEQSTGVYLRDLYDHTVQVMDTVETFREMLSGMLDIYLSSVSNRMNEVMKVLTIIATIFIPLTFLVGVYGMNFKHMPELDWTWGYPALWGVMVAVALIMLAGFKKKGWM